MLLNLEPNTKKAVEEMKSLGLVTYDSAKAMDVLTKMGLKPASGSFEDVQKAIGKHLIATEGLKEGSKQYNKELSKTMSSLGIYSNLFFDQTGKMKSAADVSQILQDKLKGLSKEQQISALQTIFGTDAVRAASIMMKEGSKGYNDMTDALKKVTAADTAKTKMDNLTGTLTKLKNSFDTFKISIGNVILPMLKDFAGRIQGLVDKFNGMSDAQKENLVKIGLFAGAGLGLIAILGTLGGAIGGIVTGVGGMITILGFLASGPGLLTIGVLGGIALGVKEITKKIGESSIPINNFGDSVSESTKKAAGKFIKMHDDIETKMLDMKLNNERMTGEMAANLEKDYKDMNDAIIKSIQERAQKEDIEMQNIILNNTSLSQEEKLKIIEQHQQSVNARIKAQNDMYNQLKAIDDKAAKEGRQTTEQEEATKLSILNKWQTTGIKEVSKSQQEQNVILDQLYTERENRSAQEASKLIQNEVKKKNAIIKEAQDTYNQNYQMLLHRRDVEKSLTDKQFDDLLAGEKKRRDTTVGNAKKTHNEFIGEVMLQNQDYLQQMDFTSGKINSQWDMFMGKGIDTINANEKALEEVGLHINMKTGEIVDETGTAVDTLKQNVDKVPGDLNNAFAGAKAEFDKISNGIKTTFNGIDLKGTGKNILGGLIQGMMDSDLFKSIEGIGQKVVSSFKSYFKIQSPSKLMNLEVGQWLTKGVAQGMLDHIHVVQNASEQVSNAVKVQGSMSGGVAMAGVPTSNSYTNNITIQGGSSATEIARQQELLLRRLQFQGGIPR